MILLCDVGNTHTHVGLAGRAGVGRRCDIPTPLWGRPAAARRLARFVGAATLEGAALCSVVPGATPLIRDHVTRRWQIPLLELRARNIIGLEIDYPRPETIGPDRLANALAARRMFGAPVVILDFGTAVTLDALDRRGRYVGGVIAPGLAAMTEYLHEKTALLPRIRIRKTRRAIGRSTEEAMRVGAVRGYRGLIRELVRGLKRELGVRRLPVVATGGYAQLMAEGLAEIVAVRPALTLEGLRLFWLAHRDSGR